MNIRPALLALAAFAAPAMAQTPAAPAPTYATVPSAAFAANRGKAVLVDIREPAEWKETGMPAGAVGVSISRPDFVEAVSALVGGDKSRPVALICRSGTRSIRAADQLTAAGFTRITNVGDGMIGRAGVGDGWKASGLPVQPAP
jgi:rhodanese-related sulfurtransferase